MDEASELDARTLFKVGFFFELSLVLVAALLWWTLGEGVSPFRLSFSLQALGWSVAAALPWTGAALFLTSGFGRRVSWIRRIYERVREVMGSALRDLKFDEIVLLAGAAGIGEEVLFRGVLQSIIGPSLTGILITSVIFGLLHALTLGYLLLATLISLYLGWLQVEMQNLLVPICVHWLYDTVALCLLRRQLRAEETAPEQG